MFVCLFVCSAKLICKCNFTYLPYLNKYNCNTHKQTHGPGQVSQAAGRLIRHQMDFGVLFSIDQRYTTPSSTLAPWIVQNRITAGPDLFDRVSAFFEDRHSLAAARANQTLVVHAPLFKKSVTSRGDMRSGSHSTGLASSSSATTGRRAMSPGTEPPEAPRRPSDLISAEF